MIDTPATKTLNWRNRPSLWNGRSRWLLLLVGAFAWSLAQAGLFSNRALVNGGGWPQFARFWQAALQPIFTPQFLELTLEASLVTLAYAVTGTVLAVLAGCFFGLLSSELWWRSVLPQQVTLRSSIWRLIRVMLAVPRGVHELLWGLLFLNVFGLDPLVAILAIAVPYCAIIAKVFSELLDEAPREPYLALLHSGVTPLKAYFYALIPVALADLTSYAFYRLECAIRAAAVLGIVGAGGIGYQILLSMQTLNYNETWTLFYALMLLSGTADWWSATVRRSMGGEGHRAARPGVTTTFGASRKVLRSPLLVGIILALFSLWYLQPNWSLLWATRSRNLLGDIAARSWPLNLDAADIQQLLELSQATLAMSLLAALLAGVGGAIFSFAAARTLFGASGVFGSGGNGQITKRVQQSAVFLTQAFLLLMRAVPAPIWALAFLFIFFPGMLPGILALAVYNMGVLGRLMAEIVDNEDKRPSVALRSTGASSGSVFFYGLLPAVSPRYLALALYRWENAIRETIIVGIVGAGGLGRELNLQLAAFNYRAVVAILLCIIVLTFAVDMLSAAVRKTV